MDIAGRLKLLRLSERHALLVLLGVFCAFGVFDHSLWAPNDSREGAMIWDMFRSGDWTKPSLNGSAFLEKPPLLHWTALVLCRLFGGINEGLVRLPAALYGFGALLIVYRWGRDLGRERAGLLAAFMCATTLLYAEYSRIVLTDMCLTFMVTLSLHAFWTAYSAENRTALRYAAFLAVGVLSFYAKGLIGPGLVITSVAAFLALRREWKLAIVLVLLFVPLLAAAVLPWAVALYREGGREYLSSVFIDNQFGRFFALPRGEPVTSLPIVGRFLGFMADRPIAPDPYFVHKEPIYFYAVKLAKFWLPWTLLVPPALAYWFRRETKLESPLCSLLRAALVTMVVVLHLSSAKVACYALPLFPIVFFMVGVWCDDALASSLGGFGSRMERVTSAFVQVLLFALPIAYLICLVLPRGSQRFLEAALHGLGSTSKALDDPLIWVRTSDSSGTWRGAGLCAIALALAVFAVRRVRAASRTGNRAGGLVRLVAAYSAILMLSFAAVIPAYDRQRTYQPVAALVRAEIAQGRCIALAVGQEKDVGEFTYYADTRLPEVSLIPGVREFLEQGGQPRGVIVHAEDLDRLRESLKGVAHEVHGVSEDSGFISKSFRLITRS